MSEIPFWGDEGDGALWDSLYLGDRVWPGQWKVEMSKSRSVDKAKAQGKDGQTLTNKGYVGAPVTATGILWLKEHLTDLADFLPTFDPEFAKIAEPLDIYHPVCELMFLTQVFIKTIKVSQPAPGGKWTTVSIEMDQWFPPAKITKAKPTGFSGASLAGSTGFSGAPNPADFRVGPPKL